MPKALQSEGKAKAYLTKGATATCPKCCGPGAPGCCFCIDIDEQDPTALCYPPGIYFPIPDPLCNPKRKCCLGSRVRVTTTLTLNNTKNTYEFNKQYQTYTETNKWTLTLTTEWHKEKQPDGSCKTIMDSAEFTTARHREYQFGQAEPHIEDTVPPLGFAPQQVSPDLFGRPEPVRLYYLLEAFTGSLFASGGQNDFGPFQNECGGPYIFKEYIPPDENQGLESDFLGQYNAAAQPDCGRLPIQVTGQKDWVKTRYPKFGEPTIEYEDHQAATLTESLVVTTLVDDCCPKEPGNPYNPAPDPIPVDPDNPGIPVDPAPPLSGVGANFVSWLGIDWIGVPAPVRVWRWVTGRGQPEAGCGCMATPKGWFQKWGFA